jgi:DNA-binding HxlR family transcriptional regulator
MKRSSFESMNCSLAQSLEIIGEWWTLLIIREALWGTSRFEDFHLRLGIARNILTTRLVRLEQFGLMERRVSAENARIFDYVLTEKGRDLVTSIVALMQWGDRWIHDKIGPPIEFFDKIKGTPIRPVAIQTSSGKSLAPDQIEIRPGPGANKATIRRAKIADRPLPP